MSANYNVNLSFTADISAAQNQLNTLQQSLTSITKASITSPLSKWTPEIQEATQAALQLKHHLTEATNTKTGTLDFSRLNDSVRKSGMSLTEYGRKLQSLGPQGQQAFMQLAGAVAQSEVPIRRVNATLSSLMVTLKNTAKWQLSSSALHGFMSAVSGAYSYAQDLNKSLNDIRIVTGQNIDQMSRFAEQANAAARNLSTTTNDYAKASLIYYQQGLSDSEVQARTDITIKMANAAGQSAEIVSDQLTAVWNNFYDGSKSLEYYADVMTALGAATASSTDEIAGGLEKFAAIGETIGLSYEYAASALATITSNTRQSEEVVGTALKTIFARIQGLELGETLEDGVNLNKYSEALEKVGISIFDQAGEMKSMDNILNEMASTWGSLSNAQQTALAQTVAGVRQYTQLVALMENWNKGDADSMISNLDTAYGASGTLDKQAETFAESWEAARNRVKAAAEDIYSSLIDEDFFINTLDGVENLLSGLSTLIDSLGGVKGILAQVAQIATRVFSKQMAQGIRNMAFNLKTSTEAGRNQIEQQKIKTLTTMGKDMAAGADLEGSRVGKIAAQQYQQQLELQRQLTENSKNMSESEIQSAKQLLDIRSQITQEVIKAATETERAKEKVSDSYMQGMSELYAKKPNADNAQARQNEYTIQTTKLKQNEQALHQLTSATKEYSIAMKDANGDSEKLETIITEMAQAFEKSGMSTEQAGEKARALANALNSSNGSYEEMVQLLGEHSSELLKSSANAQNQLKNLGLTDETIKKLIQDYRNLSEAERRELEIKMKAEMAQKRTAEAMAQNKRAVKDYADGIVAGAQALTSFASVCQAASGLLDALTNPDISGWEKFVQVMSSIGSILMSTVFMMTSLITAYSQLSAGTLKHAVASGVDLIAESLLAKAKKNTAVASKLKEEALDEENEELSENITKNVVDAGTEKMGDGPQKNLKLGDSFKKLGSTIKNVVGASKGLIAAYAAIAAGIAVVVGGIALAVNQYNAQERAVEEAAENAKMLSDRYSEVKASYDEFANTVNSYQSIKDGMKDLVKGTAEYNEQMLLANEQAMQLISKHKDLAGKYTIDGGLIVISDEDLEKVQKEELSRLGKVQAASIQAEGQVAQAEVDKKRTEFNRNMYTGSDLGLGVANTAAAGGVGLLGGALTGGGIGYKIGAAIGTAAAPGIGTAIGVVLGGLLGTAVGAISGAIATSVSGIESKSEKEAIDAVVEHYSKAENKGMFASEGELKNHLKILKDNGKISEEMAKKLGEDVEALKALTEVEYARLKQERADWESSFAAYNAGNDDYMNADSQNYLNAAAYNYSHNEADRAKVEKEVSGLFSGSNDDFWAEYLKYVYGETNVDEEHTSGDNYRVTDLSGGNATIEKKNAEGTWEKVGDANSLSEKAAEEQLINAKLMADASEKIGEFSTNYTALSNDLIAAADLDMTSDSSKQMLDNIITTYEKGEAIDLSQYGYHFAKSIDFDQIEDTGFRNWLKKSANDYTNTFSKAYQDVYNNLSDKDKEILSTIEIDPQATADEVREALEEGQRIADQNAIKGTIKFGNELKEFIESNPDAATWNSEAEGGGKKLFFDWAKNAKLIKDDVKITDTEFSDLFESFLLKSTDEKLDYIDHAIGEKSTEGYTKAYDGYQDSKGDQNEAKQYVADNADAYHFNKPLYDYAIPNSELTSEMTAPKTAEGVRASTPKMGDENARYTAIEARNKGNDRKFDDPNEWYTYGYKAHPLDGGWAQTTMIYDDVRTNQQLASDLTTFANGDSFIKKFMDAYASSDWETMLNMANPDLTQSEGGVPSYLKEFYQELFKMFVTSDGYGKNANQFTEQEIGTLFNYVYKNLPQLNSDEAATATKDKAFITNYEKQQTIAEGENTTKQAGEIAEAQQALEKYLEQYNFTIDQFRIIREDLEKGLSLEKFKSGLTKDEWDKMGDTQEEKDNRALELYDELLDKIAKKHARIDAGVQDLASNWDEWNKVLGNSNSSIMDIQSVLPDVEKAISNILDVDVSSLPENFVLDNWNIIRDVYNGVDGAIEDLEGRLAAAQLELTIKPTISTEEGMAAYNNLYNFLTTSMPDLEVGVSLDEVGMTEVFQALLDTGAVTADQMTTILNGVHFDPDIEWVEVDGSQQSYEVAKQQGGFYTSDGNGGKVWNPISAEMTLEEFSNQKILVPTINGKGATYRGGGGYKPRKTTKPKSGGGGGGSKPKKAEEVKKTDIVERYKETEDALDDLRDTIEDVNKATDRLYGASRIKQMELNNKLLGEEVKLLKQKKKEAEAYLVEDRKTLNKKASKAGVSFTFDENGNISNYTSQLTKLYNQLDGTIKSANKDGNATEKEQEKIDDLQKKIDELKDAISQYDETKEMIEDLENELDDKFYEWQDNNAEILTYKLELQIELKDDDLELLDYYLQMMEDDFYQRAESLALLNQQMDVHTQKIQDYEGHMKELQRAYDAGEISQAAYIEGIDNLNDGIQDAALSLKELDDQMMHYYGETLQAAAEEIDKVNEKMEHQNSILEHYLTLMDLMGESVNYEKTGEVLTAQSEMLKNEMTTQRDQYLDLKSKADEQYRNMMSASNESEAELYRQQYEDALKLANEAQEEYLSLAEAYAEKLREILDNSLSKYAQDLENSLTGGTSFDQMSTRWERAAALQEEYLTNTNKIYETTKLMNSAQKEIDKTTNTVAKQRLKQFITETDQLQKKNRLSQYELEIQQAKYDLLLAELALEEARDAKSQVRLQRDSEGNFGYVYTANAEEIADAEEKLLDAQNELYNKALEGANGYAEKYQQTLNEMYDALTDLQEQYLDGAFETEEEYQNAVLETKQYYYSLLEDYADLYTIAISTDARALEDSWTQEFNSMIFNTENWKDAVETYVGNVHQAFRSWREEMDYIASDVGIGGNLEHLTEKVSEVSTEHQKLVDYINGPLKTALQNEIAMVGEVTSAYAKLRQEQEKVMKNAGIIMEQNNKTKKEEAKKEEKKNVANSATPTTGTNTANKTKKAIAVNGKINAGKAKIYEYPNEDPENQTYAADPKYVVLEIKGNWVKVRHHSLSRGTTGWFKKGDVTALDTGGYTGSWGSYGKLAFLHEKELVLNKGDTANLLTSMNLLNNIIQTIDLHTANAQTGAFLNSPSFGVVKNSEPLEQQINIEAHFPNVSSRLEIEEAFSTMRNRASQYANRK